MNETIDKESIEQSVDAAPDRFGRWLQFIGPAILLVLASVVLYAGAANHFRLDGENELIWDHPGVAEGQIGTLLEGRWQDAEYRPQVRHFPVLIHALEHTIFDFNRGSFQFVLIILHGLAAALVFLLMSRWLGSVFLGALGGLLFVTHPALSHSVLYLGGISEIVCTILCLGTLLTIDRLRTQRSSGLLFLIGVLSFLAMLSKEVGFLLLPVAAGSIWASRRDRADAWVGIQPVLAAAALAALLRFVSMGLTPEPYKMIPAVDPTTALPLIPLLFQTIAGVVVEIFVMIFPLKLTHDYSWIALLDGAMLYALASLAVVVVVAVLWLAFRSGGSFPRTGLALLALLPLVAPALVPHLQGTWASERNLYIALPGWIGLLLLLVHSFAARGRGVRTILAGATLLLVVLFGVRTVLRVPDFESRGAMVAAGLRAYPNNPQALFEQGNLQLARLNYEGAVESYQDALERRPDFPLASVNLGAAYIGLEEWGLALRTLDPVAQRSKHIKTLRLTDAKAHYHAGLVLLNQRRDREAALAFERMLLFYPDHLGARGNLGLMYIGAPEYVERGMEILQGVLELEENDERRTQLRRKIQRAQELLDGFIDDQGGLPSEVGREGHGAIGNPWEEVAEEGM